MDIKTDIYPDVRNSLISMKGKLGLFLHYRIVYNYPLYNSDNISNMSMELKEGNLYNRPLEMYMSHLHNLYKIKLSYS